jgi:methylated-DNA-protein-cysteine methyltransferase-like protein
MNAYASPPNLRVFQARVWDVARFIPPGKVATYGQIAGLLPPPEGMDPKAYLAFGPRWVGGAMAACPADVPWQRVINSKGEISPRPGAQNQRLLLEQEGVEFDDRGRIDLKIYRWDPDETWCRVHDLVPPPQKPRQESLI